MAQPPIEIFLQTLQLWAGSATPSELIAAIHLLDRNLWHHGFFLPHIQRLRKRPEFPPPHE